MLGVDERARDSTLHGGGTYIYLVKDLSRGDSVVTKRRFEVGMLNGLHKAEEEEAHQRQRQRVVHPGTILAEETKTLPFFSR